MPRNMKKVLATSEDCQVEAAHGPAAGMCLTCTRCQYKVEVIGRTGRSLRFGLMTLRSECPKDEENYYTAVGDEKDLK